jgi:hypothetical protein
MLTWDGTKAKYRFFDRPNFSACFVNQPLLIALPCSIGAARSPLSDNLCDASDKSNLCDRQEISHITKSPWY